MQETKYGIKLAQEDYRWMIGDADLGNVLAPFSTSAVAPVSLDAAAQPPLELRSALVTLSVDINALTQEQVRLREALEALPIFPIRLATTLLASVLLPQQWVRARHEPPRPPPKVS